MKERHKQIRDYIVQYTISTAGLPLYVKSGKA